MDANFLAATMSALEAATEAMIVALGRRPDADLEAADQLRTEMESLRDRLASTRELMRTYRKPARAAGEVR